MEKIPKLLKLAVMEPSALTARTLAVARSHPRAARYARPNPILKIGKFPQKKIAKKNMLPKLPPTHE